jgi:hypothetical protein
MDHCRSKKIAIWDDESRPSVRLPRMFAYEQFDLGDYVDVFCVGKMTQGCVTASSPRNTPPRPACSRAPSPARAHPSASAVA